MGLSNKTQETIKELKSHEDEKMAPEGFLNPEQGWQCPACGAVYDKQGICPVDETLLTQVGNWAEAEAEGPGSPKDVMDKV